MALQPRPMREQPQAQGLGAPQFVADEPPPDNSYKDPVTGEMITPQEDGSVIIGDKPKDSKDLLKGFYGNLADKLTDYQRADIAEDLLRGIVGDIQSRKDWEDAASRGLDLLGLRMEEAGTDSSTGTVSRVYHTLLINAVVRYQANARAELLPSGGPVKVRDDLPVTPPPPQAVAPPALAPPAQPPTMGAAPVPPAAPNPIAAALGSTAFTQPEPGLTRDVLSNAFEQDFNHYLTVVAKEYYPDFDRMLFSLGLIGNAFRKCYHCPIRRRPVSEWVPAQDFIVSNEATDIYSAGRYTHRLKMRNAVVKRMISVGYYRDVDLSQPLDDPTEFERTIKSVEGVDPMPVLPADHRHTIYETYVDLDLPGFEEDFPVPYRVTMEKDSRQVLEIRRNWKEGDEDFIQLRRFVKYGMIPGLGFYDYGYIHLLGNTQRALTAIERQLLDAGQFANFPGFLLSRMGQRQITNQIRISPGGAQEIDTGGLPINQVAMPLPYKGADMVLMQLAQAIAQDAAQLAGTAMLPVSEGNAEVPVGTMIAMIEQNSKPSSAIHMRNHASQQEEFEILRELFKEDPRAIWKFAKNPARKWQTAEEFADLELVPASDPNTPSHIHRIMQATALIQLSAQSPGLYNMRNVHEKALRVLGVGDINELLNPPPPPMQPGAMPPNPEMMKMQGEVAQTKLEAALKMQEQNAQASHDAQEGQQRMAELQIETANDQAERESRERMAGLKAVSDAHKIQNQGLVNSGNSGRVI